MPNMKRQRIKPFHKGISPIRILPIGYLAVTLTGTLLLMLPIAAHGTPLGFFDALFTATSASCVTGLVVVDTGTRFTFFGQAVLLLLIQLGGLGFMTAATLLFRAAKKRISLRSRMTLAEAYGEDRLQGIIALCMRAVTYTFTIEGVGALLLSLRFIPEFGPKGIWYAVFHSISAFCNAGFDLMGSYSSLTGYVSDPLVNFTVMALVILGGIGFAVITEVLERRSFKRLSMHAKVVLCGSAILTFGGAALFLLFESANPTTLGSLNAGDKLMASLFQSVTCRTAGFNTVAQDALTDAGKLTSVLLMLVGGSPAGTAGGVKVTTVAVLFLTGFACIRNLQDTEVFGRRLSSLAVRKALSLMLIFMGILLTFVAAILHAEQLCGTELSFIDILYESTSALATVGLSLGLSGSGSLFSKILICLMMYLGRAGIMTVALAIGGSSKESPTRRPEGSILIG